MLPFHTRIGDFFEAVLRVRPVELRRTAIAFVYLFTAVGAFIVGRITRSVLFLEIPDYRNQLPLIYILIAVSVTVIMSVYARIERKLKRDRINALTLGIMIVITLVFHCLLTVRNHLTYWFFYLWAEIYGAFLIVQFWSLANEIFNARQAKRLFAIIGGGGVLANVVVGFAISGSVKQIGTENLTLVIIGLLLISLAAVILLGRSAKNELTLAHGKHSEHAISQDGAIRIWHNRHVRLIAIVVVLTYVVSTFVDYQYQVIIGDYIPLKDERSAFFGAFFGITGIAAAIIQFTLTAHILERFGILFALAMLPITMLTGSVSMLFISLIPALWSVSAVKGGENIFRYTVNDSTMQLLYLPLPVQLRSRAKTLIDGMLRPIAIGSTGIIMAILVGQFENLTGLQLGLALTPRELGWVVLLGLGLWLLFLFPLHREYLSSLLHTLKHRRLNFNEARFTVNDDATIKTLLIAINANDDEQVIHALELIRSLSPRVQASIQKDLLKLLHHKNDAVRVATLELLAETANHIYEINSLLQDKKPEVRCAAIKATCAILQQQSLDLVEPMLNDSALKVRAAAVAGLIRFGGLDGVLACATHLKSMFSSTIAGERQYAAWVLGEVGVQSFYQPLLPLFVDDDEQVRRAAIIAAGVLQAPRLIAPLIAQLANQRLAKAAATSLYTYGATISDDLAKVINDDAADIDMRVNACRVLARSGDKRGVELLIQHLTDKDVAMRSAAIASLRLLRNNDASLIIKSTSVNNAIRFEVKYAYTLLAIVEDLALDESSILLRDTFAHRIRTSNTRLFGLLSLKYRVDTIDLVSRNYFSMQAATRANAVEVLDNLLSTEDKSLAIPLLDDDAPLKKLAYAENLFAIERCDRHQRLLQLLNSNDQWLCICAMHAIYAWNMQQQQEKEMLVKLLNSSYELCRETALVALFNIGAVKELKQHLAFMLQDTSMIVQRYANYLQQQLQA
ncbi:MAG: HEAT repeat domain-containing protein [Deltaproteobacteria bacterium]|nr:HEAT repeat domain-containing protein [Deltaproteobacteria bacterium]